MIEILIEIAKLSPIIGILIVAIIYFYRKEKSYKLEIINEKTSCDAKIAALNKELRENEKENLEMMSKLASSLDKIATNNTMFHQEIQSLKEYIGLKIDALK